jgi:hypothetical protein
MARAGEAPADNRGFCEAYGTNSVVSALVLAEII